jgi:hypothetical protein
LAAANCGWRWCRAFVENEKALRPGLERLVVQSGCPGLLLI